MNAVIYHNPKCGTSRNTLAMIRFAGIEPEVIDYLAHPPSRAPGRPHQGRGLERARRPPAEGHSL